MTCEQHVPNRTGLRVLLCAIRQMLHHALLGIDAVHAAPRNHVRKAQREITGAGTDVRNHGIGLKLERLDHVVGLLPRIALRVIEDLGPFLRIIEAVVVRVRRLRSEGTQKREAEHGAQEQRNRCEASPHRFTGRPDRRAARSHVQ